MARESRTMLMEAINRVRKRLVVASLTPKWSVFGIGRRASLVVQSVEHPPAMQKTWVQSLGQEDPLEGEMATHSGILAWIIPWTEKPGSLYSPWGRKELDTTNTHRHWKKDGCTLSCSVMSDSLRPQGLAHQASLSMGLSRQKHSSGLSFYPPGDLPDPGIKSASPIVADRLFITEPPGKPWKNSRCCQPKTVIHHLALQGWSPWPQQSPDLHTPERSPEWTPGMRLSMFWKKTSKQDSHS